MRDDSTEELEAKIMIFQFGINKIMLHAMAIDETDSGRVMSEAMYTRFQPASNCSLVKHLKPQFWFSCDIISIYFVFPV